MTSFDCRDVMRFLGQKAPLHGNAFPNEKRQIVTDQRGRAEGIRVKHRLGSDSIKMYNKQGSVLRVETTLNDVRQLKSPRRADGQSGEGRAGGGGPPGGKCKWMPMRKGVADARQRARVSDTANRRYVDAIAAVATPATLASVTRGLCDPVTWKGRRVRGLKPLHEPDARLLAAVCKGEFLLHGLRNRDLQAALFADPPRDDREKARRSAHVSRKLRMLRAHGLLSKLPNTHRYVVSDNGRRVITALIAVRQLDINNLPNAA